jgi:hypothetical protein
MTRELIEAIQRIAGTYMQDSVRVFFATVDSVDEDTRTCDVTPISDDSDTPFPGVQLQAESTDGMLMLPKTGSVVMVAVNKRGVAYVALFSELEKVVITATATQFNDGSYGGLVIIGKLVEKINRLENAFNSHTHGGVSSGSSSTSPTTSPISPVTQQSELENTTVTHGK